MTKFFLTGTFVSGLAVQFGLIPTFFGGGGVGSMVFDWHAISSKFHVWRLITPFLFAGTFSINFVMHLFVLYENCRRYEANPFNTGAGGTSADFLYMVVLGMVVFCTMAAFESTLGLQMQLMSEPILYYILYVWSRKEPDTVVNMWGFKFKGLYLPWVYMALRVLMGGGHHTYAGRSRRRPCLLLSSRCSSQHTWDIANNHPNMVRQGYRKDDRSHPDQQPGLHSCSATAAYGASRAASCPVNGPGTRPSTGPGRRYAPPPRGRGRLPVGPRAGPWQQLVEHHFAVRVRCCMFLH